MVFVNFFQIIWDPALAGGSKPGVAKFRGGWIITPYIIKLSALPLGLLHLIIQIHRLGNNRLSLKGPPERRIEFLAIMVQPRTPLIHLSAAVNTDSKRLHLENDPLCRRYWPLSFITVYFLSRFQQRPRIYSGYFHNFLHNWVITVFAFLIESWLHREII
jgi:hypothetical protein